MARPTLPSSLTGTASSSWLDQLRAASWREVPFQVDTAESIEGDNVVLREYPFQDLPTVFRMGTAANEIKLAAYVIGDDYLEQLDRLRAVLTGEGVLVHPTQGSIRCWSNGKFTVKEAITTEGGCARLDLTFVRAEARRYPTGVANTAEQTASAADTAQQSLLDSFTANFALSGLAGWARDNVLTRLRTAIDTLWDGISYINRGSDLFDSLVKQYITFPLSEISSISSLLGQHIADLTQIPQTLTSAEAWSAFSAARNLWIAPVANSVAGAAAPAPGFAQAINPSIASAYASIGFVPRAGQMQLAAAFTPDVSPYQTDTRVAIAQSLKTLENLFNGLVMLMAVRAITQVELDNYDQARALRTDFSQQITELIIASAAEPVGGVGEVTTHDALAALKTAVLADLQARSRDLSRLTTYTPTSWQPALYVSYRLWGTVRWADEIVATNPHVRHPLLLPPGVPLRIVRHD